MAESNQHRLDRVRAPRVQITYDVEIGDATQQKELPFVVGVMADLSGDPAEPLPRLKGRRFLEIDRDNLEDVLEKAGPRLALRVPDRLTGAQDSKLAVELRFRRMEDFEPHRVAEQIEPLRELLRVRRHLSDLLARLDGNDALAERLAALLADADGLKAVRREVRGALAPPPGR